MCMHSSDIQGVQLGGRAGRSWPGGHGRPLGLVGGPAGGLSGGGADEWTDGRSRAGGWWADG